MTCSHEGASIFHPQARSRFVVCQEIQLLLINRPSSLLSDKGHCVLALHAGFHEGEGDEDGGAAQAGDAVDSHAAAGRLGETRLEQIAPILDNLRRRRHPVVERPIHNQYPLFL